VLTPYADDVQDFVAFRSGEQERQSPKRQIEYPNFRMSTLPFCEK